MVRGVAWFSLLSCGAVLLASCSVVNGRPMKGSDKCRYMPTIEECQGEAARLITDEGLKRCVIRQCEFGIATCTDKDMEECAEHRKKYSDGDVAGLVPPRGQTSEDPLRSVKWCQIDQHPWCQTQSMVHERAHACGWHHHDGKGVPGNDGPIQGCKWPPD